VNAEDKFIAALMEDVSTGQLELPTLPEVAIKVRKLVDDPMVSADKIAKLVGTDAALSARLLQVANSVFFRGLNSVDNVRTAVVRLGGVCVRNVVASLVMRQLYQAEKMGPIKQDMLNLWVHGARVAAISHVLARRFTRLNPDEAMLAGLIHDIGILPILKRATKFPEVMENKSILYRVIDRMHQEIGQLILEEWHFPPQLVQVAAEHEDYHRNPGPEPDYTDVVLVANLHSYMGQPKHKANSIDWNGIPAFEKLELTPEQSVRAMAEAQADIAEIQKVISG
jgi:HD-like signal output (HDOD) protein